MKTSFDTLNDVAGYVAKGIYPLPFIYSQFLTILEQQERNDLVCLLPITRFLLYNLHIEQKIQQRLKTQQRRKVA